MVAEIITTRDIHVGVPRVYREPSYFEMHVLLKELERLQREREILTKRIIQIDAKMNQLRLDMDSIEKSIAKQRL